MGWRSLRASRWVWASSPKWAMGWLLMRAVAARPGSSQAGASAVKVRGVRTGKETADFSAAAAKCAASGRNDGSFSEVVTDTVDGSFSEVVTDTVDGSFS